MKRRTRLTRWAVVGVLAVLVPLVSACRREVSGPAVVEPVLPRIPRDAPRFEIDSVTDSTAIFRVQESRWIRAGMQGYAVDAAQRDALVARLTIMSRDSLTATALVTSQVARVRRDHMLLVLEPPRPWWKSGRFWWGVVLGAGVGSLVTAAF
ncbi:MAG: hypothetical protein IBJ19_05875 [Gemmatimonadaceae bacterium]|nr:hypothetical protein [Gemmatimonadaceae bacterium]